MKGHKKGKVMQRWAYAGLGLLQSCADLFLSVPLRTRRVLHNVVYSLWLDIIVITKAVVKRLTEPKPTV